MLEIVSKSAKQTQKIAKFLAEETAQCKEKHALVFALEGELGSGKTTFTQAFARALGVKEKITSPTFVLIKTYSLIRYSPALGFALARPRSLAIRHFKRFVHLDCYRLDSPKDLLHLGFKKLLKDKNAIVMIEWADRIHKLLPKNTTWVKFEHGHGRNKRTIKLKLKSKNEKRQGKV